MNKEQAVNFINDIKPSDVIVHLSHIDLDGYGASYIVKQHLTKCLLIQANTNYGEIIEKLKEMNVNKSVKVIITDLNLTLQECEELNDMTNDWIVVDHHGTGQDSFKAFEDNYLLDTEQCATKLIFDILHDSNFATPPHLSELSRLIDTYDMWRKENDILFKKGMLLTKYIYNMPFEADSLKLIYTEWLFDKIAPFLLEYGVQECEIQYQRMFLFWLSNIRDDEFARDVNLPSNIKCALMHLEGIEKYIVHNNKNYVIFSGLTTKVTQYAFDELFKREDYKNKVLINFNQENGNVAFRSINNQSSVLAKKCGGGGHPNAAGCRLKITDKENALQQLIFLIEARELELGKLIAELETKETKETKENEKSKENKDK